MAELTIHLKSRILGCPNEVHILMPDVPGDRTPEEYYASGRKLKVLWLLHGASLGGGEWVRDTSLPRYTAGRELMVVLPSALNSDYSNYVTFANGFAFWDYFTQELMPLIYGWFPASRVREDNYIAGFSMGGTGAMMFGFAYPEKFGGIGVMASAIRDVDCLRPCRDMTSAQFRAEGTDERRFPGVYPGGFNLKEINMIAKYPTVGDFLDSPENTWDRFAEVQRAGKLPDTYVIVGTEDRCRERVRKFETVARELGASNITFDTAPGFGHTVEFSDYAVQRVLDHFGL